MFGLGKFFGRGSLEDELKKNPKQPEKWLKLAQENEKRAPEAVVNALIYSEGKLIDEAAAVVRNLAIYRELEPHLKKLEEALGKEYSSSSKV